MTEYVSSVHILGLICITVHFLTGDIIKIFFFGRYNQNCNISSSREQYNEITFLRTIKNMTHYKHLMSNLHNGKFLRDQHIVFL